MRRIKMKKIYKHTPAAGLSAQGISSHWYLFTTTIIITSHLRETSTTDDHIYKQGAQVLQRKLHSSRAPLSIPKMNLIRRVLNCLRSFSQQPFSELSVLGSWLWEKKKESLQGEGLSVRWLVNSLLFACFKSHKTENRHLVESVSNEAWESLGGCEVRNTGRADW